MNNSADEVNTMNINYSLVQDSLEGIRDFGSFNHVTWGEGNLDSNPVFLGTEQFPYAIDAGYPCIEAGTLDLPPGNPRVPPAPSPVSPGVIMFEALRACN